MARIKNGDNVIMKYDYDGGNSKVVVKYSGLIKTMAIDEEG